MNTAVQIRQDSRVYGKLLYGDPFKSVQNEKGEVAIFQEGEIVGYFLAWGERRRHLYLFQCGKGEASVPGVYPAVKILVDAGTRTRVSRLRNVLDWLQKNNYDMKALPDGFYARLQALIEGKKMTVANLKEILSHGHL